MNDARRALLKTLHETFPVIAERKPLAIGAFKELLAVGYDVELLRTCMKIHVESFKYLRAVSKGGQRHHLDGTEAGAIEPEHAEFARQKVEEFVRLTAARKLRKKEQEALIAAKREREAVAKAPAEPPPKAKVAAKPVVKTPPAASAAITIVVKKKRVLQVPK